MCTPDGCGSAARISLRLKIKFSKFAKTEFTNDENQLYLGVNLLCHVATLRVILGGHRGLFSSWPRQGTSPPAGRAGSRFPTPSPLPAQSLSLPFLLPIPSLSPLPFPLPPSLPPPFPSFLFLIIAILVDVKCCLYTVVLLCIFLMIRDIEHLFMCMLVICVLSLENVCSKILHFLRLFVFLLLNYKIYLYVVDTSLLDI